MANATLCVMDLDPASKTYSQIVGRTEVTTPGDEHPSGGTRAARHCLCPHPHVERRYLIVPGIRSSRIYIFDTKPDPASAHRHVVIEPEELFEHTGYSRPHTIHCGPDAIYISARGAMATDPEDFSARSQASTCWGDGKWIAGRSTGLRFLVAPRSRCLRLRANGARPM